MKPAVLAAVLGALALGAAVAAAGGTHDSVPFPGGRVDVEVGRTVERDVGYARGGWFCDDPTLITADLVTRVVGDHDFNVWIVTGAKAGATQCRVGLDRHRPSLWFDVVVAPR